MAKLGRPTDYDPKMCEEVLEFMAAGSCGLMDVSAYLGIANKTLYRWMDKYPDFRQAIERGRELSYQWWTKQLKDGIWIEDKGKRLNNAGFAIAMRNIFKWDSQTQESVPEKHQEDASLVEKPDTGESL